MSYGIDLDPPENYESEMKQLSFVKYDSFWEDLPNPFYRQRKQRIVDAITTLDLGSSIFLGRDGYIELNHDTGIQVMLFDTSAAVTIPYWYPPDSLEYVFPDFQLIIWTIQSITNYQAHDSQVGRIIDVYSDYHLMLRSYSTTMQSIRRIFN